MFLVGSHSKPCCLQVSSGLRATVIKFTNEELFASLPESFLNNNNPSLYFHCFSFLGVVAGELPECTQDLMIDVTRGYYSHFLPVQEVK